MGMGLTPSVLWTACLIAAAACSTFGDRSTGDRAAIAQPFVAGALEDFVGEFAGTLYLASGQQVEMRLEVAPVASAVGRFHWRLTYAGQPVRDYVLVALDAAAGRFAIDEQNGIVLPASLLLGELVSVFRVGKNLLDVRYRLCPDGVEFALESFDPEAGEPAGNGVLTIPRVAVQRALLRRQ